MLDYGECSIAVVLEFKGPVGIIEWSGPLQERHWLELREHLCTQNSRTEYEHALPGDSNLALLFQSQCTKVIEGNWSASGSQIALRLRNGQRYPNQGHFRHSRSSGALHFDLQNEEESTEIDSDTAPRAQSESMHEKAPPPWRYFRLREGQGFFLRVGC